jgi:hypothetical protein
VHPATPERQLPAPAFLLGQGEASGSNAECLQLLPVGSKFTDWLTRCAAHDPQDTIKAFREASTSSPTLAAGQPDPQQAKSLGQYPHGRPFLWPAPRDPATYNTHPLKPSENRWEPIGLRTSGLALLAQGGPCSLVHCRNCRGFSPAHRECCVVYVLSNDG